MKKWIALLLCMLMIMPQLAMGDERAPIYKEDFEDGKSSLSMWVSGVDAPAYNEIMEEDGNTYLHCVTATGDGPNGYTQMYFGPELRNFDMTLRVRPYIKNADHNWLKIFFRAHNSPVEGGDGLENESYMFNIWEWRGVFTIKSNKNRMSETNALVENQDFWFDNGTWYDVKIVARENNIKVYVDGELLADYTDTKNVRPKGVFGLCSWGANFDVDDIKIYSYDEGVFQAADRGPAYGEHVTIATVDYDEMYWDPGLSYTRIIELQHSGEHNGTLMATYEIYTSGLHVKKPGYNIHISTDGGSTWEYVTTVREKAAAIQSEWQPFIYELPCQIGDMPEGTLILSACSIDAGHGRQSAIRLYRSYDIGKTWEQFGTVAVGGGLETGVWEPFMMVLPDGRLACYYSDSTEEPQHSQKLVMRISEDGVNWGDPKNSDDAIDIMAMKDQTLRPGMLTVIQLNDGRFMMAYEMVDADNPNSGNPCYYKFSTDGIDWGDVNDPGIKVKTDKGWVPGSSPYLCYVPNYGDKGLILMTATFQTPGQNKGNIVYVNDNLGDKNSWRAWYLPQSYTNPNGGYSRAMFTAMDGETVYFVNNIPDPMSTEDFKQMIFVQYRFDKKLF